MINSLRQFPYTQVSLTENELEKISQLIYQRAGIVINSQKKSMVYNRLSPRLQQLGFNSFTQYISLLEVNPKTPEWQIFTNALTTNLTSFFREAYHFPILANHALRQKGMYRVWCAAASTGEEPFSIAITLEETLGHSITGPRVLATDIDTDVLQKARSGIYKQTDIEGLTEQQKKNHFLRGSGGQQNQVKIKSNILSAVQFQRLNLIESPWDIASPFDAIFCRNVMIYFDKKTQERLIQRFASVLKPGGILFVGHSEHFGTTNGPFELLGQSVYSLKKGKDEQD